MIPKLAVDTGYDEWKLAQVEDRAIRVRIRIWTLTDTDGMFHALMVTPLAVVVDDPQGKHVVPLEGGEPGKELGEFLDLLLTADP